MFACSGASTATARPPYRVRSTRMWWLASWCRPKLPHGSWIAALSRLCSSRRRPPPMQASTGSRRAHCPPRARSAASGEKSSARYVASKMAPFARVSSGVPRPPPPAPRQRSSALELAANEDELMRRAAAVTLASLPRLPRSPIGASSGNESHSTC